LSDPILIIDYSLNIHTTENRRARTFLQKLGSKVRIVGRVAVGDHL
jgi:hypothetical protein